MTGRIIGTGSYVPERIVTNEELAGVVETSDEWIVSRTGIHERHIAETEGTSILASRAAKRALENAKVAAEEIEFILLATSSPDHCFPNGACEVQAAIGAVHAMAFDISAACSGFEIALSTAQAFIQAGVYKTGLIIGADCLSKLTDWSDRATCVLFGDGAGDNRHHSQCHGIRRGERNGSFLSGPQRGKFPEWKDTGAWLYLYGWPGGIQICR